MIKLNPCRCGENIDESFEIQLVWRGMGEDVGVAYCKYCKNVVPFKVGAWEKNNISDIATKAWNDIDQTDTDLAK